MAKKPKPRHSWDLKEKAKELRERRELMEQLSNPVFCGDCPSEVL